MVLEPPEAGEGGAPPPNPSPLQALLAAGGGNFPPMLDIPPMVLKKYMQNCTLWIFLHFKDVPKPMVLEPLEAGKGDAELV